MKGDMNIPPIPQTAPSSLRSGLVGGEVLKLLQPADGLIRPGQSAQAEVLSLKQNDLTFQLLLKLTLVGGRETNVQASSNFPLPLGTQLAVTQPSAGNLAGSVPDSIHGQASHATTPAIANATTRKSSGMINPALGAKANANTNPMPPPTSTLSAMASSTTRSSAR